MTEDLSIECLRLALDASLMRETAIAQNIAQRDTSGYRTVSVNFEEQITKTSNFNLENLHPFYQQDRVNSSLDEQLILSLQNATHYRALVKGLNQKLAIMKIALHGVQ